MEKIGCAVITTEEYKEIILEKERQNHCIGELEKEVKSLKKEINKMAEKISKYIQKEDDYEIKNLTLKDENTLNEDYYYNKIKEHFIQLGLIDEEYIDNKTREFYDNRKIESEDEE